MPGIEELHLRTRIVPLERHGSGWEKERIGFAPDGERGWPVQAEVLLELGIQLDVTCIVEKQIQLNVLIAGTSQQSRVECIGLRGYTRLIGPMRVLPPGGLRGQKGFQRSPIFGTRVSPVLLNRIPARAEPILIRIPILRHNCRDPFRMPQGQPKPYRSAVVEDIDRVAAEAEPLRKPLNY